MKGSDFRAREGNAYRLAQAGVEIIDQCLAQGVPFARDCGELLKARSFGGVQFERTFYARDQTRQHLLLGAYQALERRAGIHVMSIGAILLRPRAPPPTSARPVLDGGRDVRGRTYRSTRSWERSARRGALL